jgi:hypothetical protein
LLYPAELRERIKERIKILATRKRLVNAAGEKQNQRDQNADDQRQKRKNQNPDGFRFE